MSDPACSSPIRAEVLVDSADEEELLKTPEKALGSVVAQRLAPPTVPTPELPPDSTTSDSPTGEPNGVYGGDSERPAPVPGDPEPVSISPTSSSAVTAGASAPNELPSSTIPANIPEPVIKPSVNGVAKKRPIRGLDQIVRKLSGAADPPRALNGPNNKTEPREGAGNGALDPKSALDLTTGRRDDEDDAQFKAVKWGIMKMKSDAVKEPRKKTPTKTNATLQKAPAPETFAPPPQQFLRIPQYVPQSPQDPKFRSEIRLSALTGGATVVTQAQNRPQPAPEEKKLYDKRFEVRPTALVNPFPGGESSSSRSYAGVPRPYPGAAKGVQIDAFDLSSAGGAVNGTGGPRHPPMSLVDPELAKKRLQGPGKKTSRRPAVQTAVSDFHKALASAFAASGALGPPPGAMRTGPVLPIAPPPGLTFTLRPPDPLARVRGAAKRKKGALKNMLVQMVGQGPQMSTGGTQTDVPVLHQLLGSKVPPPDSFSMANMLGGSGGAVSVTPADPSRSSPVTDPSVVDRLKRLGTVIEVEEDPNTANKEPQGAPSALKMLEKMTMDPPQSPVVSALDDRPLFFGKDISVYAKKKGTSFIHPSPNNPLSIIPVGGPVAPPVPAPLPVTPAAPPALVDPKPLPHKAQPPTKATLTKSLKTSNQTPHPQQTVPHLPLVTITKAASKQPKTAPKPIQTTSQLPPPIVTVIKTVSTSNSRGSDDEKIHHVEKSTENPNELDYVPLPFLEPVIVLDEEESPLSSDGTYTFKHDNSHSVELPNDQKVFSCDICSAAFHHLHMLRKHYFRLHVARKYISEKDLEAYNIDPEKADDCNDENIYRCHTCRQCLPTKAELKSHLTDHPPVADLNKHTKGAKDYRCERCNAHFKWRKMFGKHKKSCRAPVSTKPVVEHQEKETSLNVSDDLISDESPSKDEPITAVTELALRQVIDTRAVRNLQRSAKVLRQPKPTRKTRQTVAMAIHSPPEVPEIDKGVSEDIEESETQAVRPEVLNDKTEMNSTPAGSITEGSEKPTLSEVLGASPVEEAEIESTASLNESSAPPKNDETPSEGLNESEKIESRSEQDKMNEELAEETKKFMANLDVISGNSHSIPEPSVSVEVEEKSENDVDIVAEPASIMNQVNEVGTPQSGVVTKDEPDEPSPVLLDSAPVTSSVTLNETAAVNDPPTAVETPSATALTTPSADVIETPAATVVETPAATVVETPAATVVETPAATVVETPAATVVETHPATVVETHPATVVETPAATVVETHPATVVETPPATVVETPPATVAETLPATADETPAAIVMETAPVIPTTTATLHSAAPEKTDLKSLYHCLYCNETFNNGNKKRNHTLSQHPYVRKNHPCVFCKTSSNSFKTNVELFQHMLASHPTLYFACQSCKERFYSPENLKDHNSKRHAVDSVELKEPDDKKSEVPEEALTYTCVTCQRIWLVKSCFQEHKCNLDKDKSNNPDKARPPKLRKVKTMDRCDRSDKPMRVDPETIFYSQVSLNVRNNLLHYLDGKLPQDEDDEEVEDESASKAPERNMLSFSAGFPGSRLQLIPEPEPYSRVKAQWEKYNFPKNYDGRCGLTSYIKDMSYLDISTQLIMRRNLQRLQGDPEVTSPAAPDDVPSVLALERLATQCAESFGINGIPRGDGETTLGELSGEWVRDRIYVCSVCRWETPCLWTMEDHKYEVHPQVLCPQYELVGDQRSLANTIYKRVYPVDEIPFSPEKPTLRSIPIAKVACTKCGMDGFNSRPELHIHVLACSGEPIPQWAPTPRKKRWKKRRRPRRGLKRNIPSTPHRPIKVRTKPGDTDTIQKMIANLPAKRSTRRVIGFDEADLKTRSQSTIQNITDFQGPVLLPSSRLVLPPSQAAHHKGAKPSSKGSPKTSKDLLLAPPHVPRGTELIDTSAERGDVLSSLRMMPVSTPREELLEPRQIIDNVINQKVLGAQSDEAVGHPCTGCGQTSESKNALRKHQKVCAYFRECGPNAEHKCKACSRLFDNLVALIEHSCDEMPKLEIEKDLSPVNSAEIPVLSPVQHDRKKGDIESIKLNQICGVSFVNGIISYETVESIQLADEGETNLKRKRSHSLGDIPSGRKMFRTGHRRSARLGQAEPSPIETPDAAKLEESVENAAQATDEDTYASAPEAQLATGKSKKKLSTRAERSDITKKPDINRQVLEIKAMEQSLSRMAQSPSIESESFIDDDSLWEKQAVVAISEDETSKSDVIGENTIKTVPEPKITKTGGDENKPRLKRRKAKNLRFAIKKGRSKRSTKRKPPGTRVDDNKNTEALIVAEVQALNEVVDENQVKIGDATNKGDNDDYEDLDSSKTEVVPESAENVNKKSDKRKSTKTQAAVNDTTSTIHGLSQVTSDRAGKGVEEKKKTKKVKGALQGKIVVRLKTKGGKKGAKSKQKIKMLKTPNNQVPQKKQHDLLRFLKRLPQSDLTKKQDEAGGQDHLTMTINAVASGTAETMIAMMKTNDFSSVLTLPDGEIDQILNIGSVEDEGSSITQHNPSLEQSGTGLTEEVVQNPPTTTKKKGGKKTKKKKSSLHVLPESNGEVSSEVAVETKDNNVENKLRTKGNKKQSKKKSVPVEETVAGNVLDDFKPDVKPAASQKKTKKQSRSDEATAAIQDDSIACETNECGEVLVEEHEKQVSKKKNRKGKLGKAVKVEEKVGSEEVGKPTLRKRSSKSSLMAELVEEALLGLDSEPEQEVVRTTRSKRSSQKQELASEIHENKDSEIAPRLTRQQCKKDVADTPKESVEMEVQAAVADSVTTHLEVENEDAVKKLALSKLKKPPKAAKKKGSIEAAVEDTNSESIGTPVDDKTSIDAINDVTCDSRMKTDIVLDGPTVSLDEAKIDKSRKSKKRPAKLSDSKVSADEIRPNIFYHRTSVTEVECKDDDVAKDADPVDVEEAVEDSKPTPPLGKQAKKSGKNEGPKEVEDKKHEVKQQPEEVKKQPEEVKISEQKPEVVPESSNIVPAEINNGIQESGKVCSEDTEDQKEEVKPAQAALEVKEASEVTNTQANTVKPIVPFKNKLLSGRLPSAEKAAALLSRKTLHQVDSPTEEPKKRKIFSYQKKTTPARRLTRSNSNGKSDLKGDSVIDPYDYNEDEIVPFQEPRYKLYSPPKPVLYAPPPAKRRVRKREDSPDTTTIVVQAEVHPEPPPRRRPQPSPPEEKTNAESNDNVPMITSDSNQTIKRKLSSPPDRESSPMDNKKLKTGCYDGIDVLEDDDSGSSPPQLVLMDESGATDRLNDSDAQKTQTPSSINVTQLARIDSPLRSVSPVKKDELPSGVLPPRVLTPSRLSSPMRTASPGRTEPSPRVASPTRISSPARMTSPAVSSPTRIASPARVASPAKMSSPARLSSPARISSPAIISSPARISSPRNTSPSRLSPMHTSLPLRSYGRVAKPMSPPSEPPELVDESKVTVEEKFDADSSSPILKPAAGPLSDLFDSEPPALERTGELIATLPKNTPTPEEEPAHDTEEDSDSMKSFKTFKKKGKELKLKMKKQLMRLKALKNKKKKELKKTVSGTRKEVVKISGMAWEVSELVTSPSKSEPPPLPVSVLPIIKDWDASDLWDSPIVNAVPISAPGPVAVHGAGVTGSPADPSPTHPSMPPLPSPLPAPRSIRSDSAGSTNIPSLGSILDSVNKLLNEPENNFSSLPPQYSLADLQRAMGASDAEMAVLEQLGEASCLTDYDESLRPVVGNSHLEDEWIMDLDNQAAQQPIVSSSVVESPPAGTPPPEAPALQSHPLPPSASNSSTSSSTSNMFQSKFFGTDLTGLLRQSSSMCKSQRTSPKCSSSALLAAHSHKEVVCPTCSCHFMGFPALQIHVNKVHGSQHDPSQVTGSLQNRRVVLDSNRGASRLVCFECNQILPSHLMYRHLEMDHSLEPGLVSKCSTVTGDLHEGPVVGERLKSKMSSALGDLLDKAVANILIAKNKPDASSNPTAPGLSPNAMELLSRLCTARKRDTSRINSKDMSFNKLKMSEPGALKSEEDWVRPHSSRPFLCTICGQRFPLVASRNKHEALAHKAFRNQNKMNLNDEEYYDDEDDDWRDAPSPESAFEDGGCSSLTPTCSDCGLSFDSVPDLMRHRVEDHAPRRRTSTASESGMEVAAPVSSSTASVAPRRISSASRSRSIDTTSPSIDTIADSDDSSSTAGTKSATCALPPSGTKSPAGNNSVDSPPAPKKPRHRSGKVNTGQVSKIKAEAALRMLNAPR